MKKLAKATEWNKGRTWDYDKHQFTPDGYRFYDLYCTEYCGRNHSEMQTVVVVHEDPRRAGRLDQEVQCPPRRRSSGSLRRQAL